MKKVLFTFIALLSISFRLFAFNTPYLEGYAGFMGDFTSEQGRKGFHPEIYGQGYFGGQLHFADILTLKSDFLVNTSDIIGKDVFQTSENTHSLFKLQEVSATYTLKTGSLKNNLSLFYGEFEPIGSDIFLQKQFGIQPITSNLTKSYNGLNGSYINHTYGAGFSYIMRFQQPIAAGFYIYKNFDNFYQERAFNTNFRIGGAFPFITFDWNFGFSLPKGSTKGSFKEDFIRIRYIGFQSGLNLLIGSPSSTANLFLQGGISNINVNPTAKKKFGIKDATNYLYYLVEPRINLLQAKIALTAFCIPGSSDMLDFNTSLSSMIYLREPCGINLSLESDCFHLGNKNFTVGMHGTFTLSGKDGEGKNIKQLHDERKKASSWNKNFDVTPYVSVPVHGGSVDASVTARVTDIVKHTDKWQSAIQVRVGFTARF